MFNRITETFFSFFGTTQETPVNKELVLSLLGPLQQDLWRNGNGIEKDLYYSFEVPHYYYNRIFPKHTAKALPEAFQKVITEVLGEMSANLQKDASEPGAIPAFLPFKGSEKVTAATHNILFFVLEDHLHHGVRARAQPLAINTDINTNPGTSNAKFIGINPNLISANPYFIKFTLIHEVFHALGLIHPNLGKNEGAKPAEFYEKQYEYSQVASCVDTIMSAEGRESCGEFVKCTDWAGASAEKGEKCAVKTFGSASVFWKKEDVLAVEEQMQKAKDPHFHINEYKQAAVDPKWQLLTLSAKAAGSSFFKTFTDCYIVPLLLERGYSRKIVIPLGQSLKGLFDCKLFTLAGAFFGSLAREVIGPVLKYFKIGQVESTLVMSALDSAIKGAIDVKSLAASASAAVSGVSGTIAAWGLIHTLPKIHKEPAVTDADEENPKTAQHGHLRARPKQQKEKHAKDHKKHRQFGR